MLNINTTTLIIKNTIEKEWRSKALISLMIMTIVSVFLMGSLISLTKEFLVSSFSIDVVGDKSMAIFFLFTSFWSSLLATYFGVSTAATDRESGVAMQLLSFPVSRLEYLVGRVVGCFCVVALYYLCASLLGMSGISLSTGTWVGTTQVLWAVFLNSFVWMAVCTLSLFVGLYLNRLSGFVTIIIIQLFGSSAYSYFSINKLSTLFEDFSLYKGFGALFYTLLPHTPYWSLLVNTKLFTPDEFEFKINEVVHYGVTFSFLFACMWFFFKKKEV
jgi:ABC-type transport system involved in multi-copper enzyme maturation permease subunit